MNFLRQKSTVFESKMGEKPSGSPLGAPWSPLDHPHLFLGEMGDSILTPIWATFRHRFRCVF